MLFPLSNLVIDLYNLLLWHVNMNILNETVISIIDSKNNKFDEIYKL